MYHRVSNPINNVLAGYKIEITKKIRIISTKNKNYFSL